MACLKQANAAALVGPASRGETTIGAAKAKSVRSEMCIAGRIELVHGQSPYQAPPFKETAFGCHLFRRRAQAKLQRKCLLLS